MSPVVVELKVLGVDDPRNRRDQETEQEAEEWFAHDGVAAGEVTDERAGAELPASPLEWRAFVLLTELIV
jgi:hypothetical protein